MAISHRAARVFAMQVLYGMQISAVTPGEALNAVLDSQPMPADQKAYGMKLVDLVLEHRDEYERVLTNLAATWDPERMAVVDKLVIYLGFAELGHCAEPVRVVLQECVQIAIKYSTEQSGTFVNGILHRYATDMNMLGDVK